MSAMMPCPCCGAPMAAAPVDVLKFVRLTRTERRVLDALLAIYPRETTRQALADIVWADDPNGGPDTAEASISVYVSRINAALRPLGWRAGSGRRGYHGLTLTQIGGRAE